MSVNAEQEEMLIKAVYLMLIERVCKFGTKKASRVSDKARIVRLQKILKDLENQNYFEILGVTRRSPLNIINKAYHDLAKILHPDRLKNSNNPQVIDLTDRIFTIITEAYTTLKHDEKRQLYIRELDIGQSEAAFQAEALLDQGRKSLRERRYVEALKIFEGLLQTPHPPCDTYIYFIWAKLKSGLSGSNRRQEIEELTRLLNKVPAEDRHSAHYFYAKGLLFVSIENYDRALRCMDNALAIDKNFLPAKRDELRIRRVQKAHAEKMSAKTLFMDLDLSTIFTGKKKAK
ncbi:MAG: J domain-containing protein [Bdellovibrionales bacterium]